VTYSWTHSVISNSSQMYPKIICVEELFLCVLDMFQLLRHRFQPQLMQIPNLINTVLKVIQIGKHSMKT
jgi:hypothetical protein